MAFYLARHVEKWGRIKKLYFHKFFSSIVLFWWCSFTVYASALYASYTCWDCWTESGLSRLLNVNTESKFLKIFTLEGVLFAPFSVTQNAVFIWTKGQDTLKKLHFPKYSKYTSHFTRFFWKSNVLFMTDWCWCAAAAYTYKKALLLLILPRT